MSDENEKPTGPPDLLAAAEARIAAIYAEEFAAIAPHLRALVRAMMAEGVANNPTMSNAEKTRRMIARAGAIFAVTGDIVEHTPDAWQGQVSDAARRFEQQYPALFPCKDPDHHKGTATSEGPSSTGPTAEQVTDMLDRIARAAGLSGLTVEGVRILGPLEAPTLPPPGKKPRNPN
jgi:hypothetical protein